MEEFLPVVIQVVNVVTELFHDDSSDDEEDLPNILEKNENFAEVTVENFNDKQFKEHFRMFPTTFEILLQKIHHSNDDLHEIRSGQPEITFQKQTLIAVWCLSNTECFRSVADRFGISKSCCWRTLYRMCHRFLKMNQQFKIISFPSGARTAEIMDAFKQVNGFPGICGVIDGCHIRIEKPHNFPNSYINRKGFPSVLLQGICDNNKMFLDVYAGEAGSIHDARLFRKSDIYTRIRNNQVEFPDDGHLIGDSAYPLTTKLLVPYRNNGHLTAPQLHYNQKLSEVRVIIENTFGLLKGRGRFRRLRMMETRKMDLIALLIVSACILHNICLQNRDFHDMINEENDNDVEEEEMIEGAEAIAKRNNIVNYLYNHRNV